MGNCISEPAFSGETEQAYRRRWEGGGLGDGLPGYKENQYASPKPAPPKQYTTTVRFSLFCSHDSTMSLIASPLQPTHQADLGLHRQSNFNQPKFNAPLDPIDENNSLRNPPGASPTRQQQQQHAGGGAPAPLPHATNLSIDLNTPSATNNPPSNYTKGQVIGQGAFGVVYLGLNNDTGQLIAIKEVPLGTIGGAHGAAKQADLIRDLKNEVSLFQGLRHPNIVAYLGTQRSPKAINIFMEYVPGGSIATLLAKLGPFQESVVRLYTKQILMGLAYLHGHGIIHRDVKGANILVDNTGLVKLADFGASKKIEDLATMDAGFKSVKGTPYWMAPEVITSSGRPEQAYGRQADIWSVACTVIEMATGKPPWSQCGSQVSAMFQIAKSKGPPTMPEDVSAECREFLYLCFNRNWKERPTAEKLLQHPFVAGVQVPSELMSSEGRGRVVAGTTVATGGAGAVPPSSISPLKQQQQGVGSGNKTNGMSPLGNYLVLRTSREQQRRDAAATMHGARRHLNLDAVGAGGGNANDGNANKPSSTSDTKGGGSGSQAGATTTTTVQTIKGGRSSNNNRSAGDSGSDDEEYDECTSPAKPPTTTLVPPPWATTTTTTSPVNNVDEPMHATMVMPDPMTLGELRHSGEHNTLSMSLAATVAMEPTVMFGTAAGEEEVERDASVRMPASLPLQEQNAAASNNTSNTVRSDRSEFNPMEEPAWMAAANANANAVRGSAVSGTSASSGGRHQRRPGSAATATTTTTTTTATNSLSAASEGPVVYTVATTSSDRDSAGEHDRSRADGGGAVRGVTTISHDDGVLPWDVPLVGNFSAKSSLQCEAPPSQHQNRSTVVIASSSSQSASLPSDAADISKRKNNSGRYMSWLGGTSNESSSGGDSEDVASSTATTVLPSSSVTAGHGGTAVPPSVTSSIGSGTSSGSCKRQVDQKEILGALKERANRDLRASLALFAHAAVAKKKTNKTNKHDDTPSSSSANEDEVSSPSRQRASFQPSRIPRPPSPIKQQPSLALPPPPLSTPRPSSPTKIAAAPTTRSLSIDTHASLVYATPSKKAVMAMGTHRHSGVAATATAQPSPAFTPRTKAKNRPSSSSSTPAPAPVVYLSPTKRASSGSYSEQLHNNINGTAMKSSGYAARMTPAKSNMAVPSGRTAQSSKTPLRSKRSLSSSASIGAGAGLEGAATVAAATPSRQQPAHRRVSSIV